MEEYAKILNYAIPGFMILILIEYVVGRMMGKSTIRSFDTISSLSSGMTNVIKDILKLTITIVSYKWFYDHFAIYNIKGDWMMYVAAFIGKDFAGYWSHRFEHVINLFWNRHIIHHSSEEFNLACALRQNVSAVFAVFTFLYIPMALIGVPPKVVAIVAPLHLFAQFWYHTTLIGKMGFLEYIIVTPSHHRVHHAINDEYIDKNFSQIFIVWDKLFGTFQEELADVPPVYGVKRAVRTWNPIIINFQHFLQLLKDAWRTASWKDKLRLWLMPTGWRPADVAQAYPIDYIEDPYTMEKFNTPATTPKIVWSWLQLIINLILMIMMFSRIAVFPFEQLLMGAAFLFISIFAYTSLMDGLKWAWMIEAVKLIWAFLIYMIIGSWFSYDIVIFLLYSIISFSATVHFTVYSNYFLKLKVDN